MTAARGRRSRDARASPRYLGDARGAARATRSRRHPGVVAGGRRASARRGGKRLRPLLVFLAVAAGRASRRSPRGVAVELVHMATLVHDDLIDGAELRRGRPAAWAAHGAGRGARGRRLPVRARVRRARRDGRRRRRSRSSPTRRLALARGEALQRQPGARPGHDVDAYLERCALKTGKLFEAACLLGWRRSGARRVRARARDRLPDRRRHPRLRGRHARDRQGPRHRPARGHADAAAAARRARGRRSSARRSPAARSTARSSASPRPARSSARARSRSTMLAARARALDGQPRREELEALTHAVVDRSWR